MTEWTGQWKGGDGLRVRLMAVPGLTGRELSSGALAEPFRFQCPPLNSFSVEYAYSHTDYETVGLGQVSRKGGRQLRTVSFESLFVDFGTWTVATLAGEKGETTASKIALSLERLAQIVESGDPFQLTVMHPDGFDSVAEGLREDALVELDMWATMRSFSQEERAGEGDARYVSVSFTEYVEPLVSRRTKRRKRKSKTWPRTHRLTENDTLRSLARSYYGAPEAWRIIARENGMGRFSASDVIVNRTALKVGAKISIPDPGSDEPEVLSSSSQVTTRG